MGGLSAVHLAREGITELTIVNRSVEKAQRLADNVAANHPGVTAVGVGLSDLPAAMAGTDVAMTCSGSVGSVVSVAEVHHALAARTATTPLVICDLGLPRNVDPAAGRLPGVELIDIEGLRGDEETQAAEGDLLGARAIVAAELADHLAAQRRAEVTPTVTALRQRANEVVEAEIMRLSHGCRHCRMPNVTRWPTPCAASSTAVARADGAREATCGDRQRRSVRRGAARTVRAAPGCRRIGVGARRRGESAA